MALHFDYEVRWKNFRAFLDTNWVVIKPLTILLGPNNAGKTSITAPLLLLDQTLKSEDSTTPLITRGDLFDAGTYTDLIHSHVRSSELFLGFRFHVHEPRKRNIPRVGAYAPGAVELTFAWDKETRSIVLKRYAVFDIYKRPMLRQTRGKGPTYTLHSYEPSRLRTDERFAVRRTAPTNCFFTVGSTLYTFDRKIQGPDAARKARRHSEAFQNYLSAIGLTYSEVRNVFDSFSYIGPIRAQPKRYYEVRPEKPSAVGARGEAAPELIRRNASKLKKDLNRWVKAFEFGDSLEVNSLSDNLYELNFVSAGGTKKTSIADAGFGASQVLPLVVQALTAERGSLCVAEQPEIHLNPRLQCVLADLLAEIANRDRRVIVETHSEHVLLRLRRLIADNKISSDKVAIYYIEGTARKATIREIELSEKGAVLAWPKGFFEEGIREALALATAQASQKR